MGWLFPRIDAKDRTAIIANYQTNKEHLPTKLNNNAHTDGIRYAPQF